MPGPVLTWPPPGARGDRWKCRSCSQAGEVCAPLETGQVVVRGEHLMSGYHGKPELTSEVLKDGRLWTRDLLGPWTRMALCTSGAGAMT